MKCCEWAIFEAREFMGGEASLQGLGTGRLRGAKSPLSDSPPPLLLGERD